MLPSVFLNLEEREKAFVVASVQVKMEHDKKRERELKQKIKKK